MNTLNAYGGCMTILTTASAFTKRKAFSQRGRSLIIVAFILVSLLVVPAVLYAVWGRRTARPPAETILMPDPTREQAEEPARA